MLVCPKWIVTLCHSVFEELFGPGACTPNMHLHGHLKECYFDYGPADALDLCI